MTYDYKEEMKTDIREFLESELSNYDFSDREELEQKLNDDLWTVDSITGNGSGSYTYNREKAREYLRGNEELLISALEEFGNEPEQYKKAITDPEGADVSIRCYLLGECIAVVLDELEEEGKLTYSEDEEEVD